jgi:hypothetical protein
MRIGQSLTVRDHSLTKICGSRRHHTPTLVPSAILPQRQGYVGSGEPNAWESHEGLGATVGHREINLKLTITVLSPAACMLLLVAWAGVVSLHPI